MSARRIEHLDALRGVAILMVVGYHAFARWSDRVPYGDAYQSVPVVHEGWLGVQLFFMISGFVILMTLDKCQSARQFLYRRWLRLFPAMLIASVLIFATAPWLTERPAGTPEWWSLVPGLTFIEDRWWSVLLRRPIEPLEGAFWSLFVEFKFYVISALVYFGLGRRSYVWLMLALFTLSQVAPVLADVLGATGVGWVMRLSEHLSFKHFGWFAAGAAMYRYWQSGEWHWLALAAAMCVVCAFVIGAGDAMVAGSALGLAVLFIVSLRSRWVQALLSNRALLWLGFVSYPLYLIHENAMIGLVIKWQDALAWLPGWAMPLVPLALLMVVAYVIARFAEGWVRELIQVRRVKAAAAT